MEHKTDWKLRDTVTPDDMNRIEGNVKELETPTFDDSGTVEGISSFTDFINSVKTKMNIFQFFRDFKAGMKYIIHTGRLANNGITTEEGFALDARMGKTLQDQITDVNKNIGSSTKRFHGDNVDNAAQTVFPNIAHSTNYDILWEAETNASLSGGGKSRLIGMYGDDKYESQMMLSYSTKIPMAMRYKSNGIWKDWDKVVLNSDLYKVFTIGDNTTFSAVLNGRSNKVTPFAFYTPKDNPFSFSAGYGIAFNAPIHHDEKMFTVIGFDKKETKMEIKEFTIT